MTFDAFTVMCLLLALAAGVGYLICVLLGKGWKP